MSFLDSFLPALASALQRPEDMDQDDYSPVQGSEELFDFEAIFAFRCAIADCVNYATSSLGHLYFNTILACRDILLAT